MSRVREIPRIFELWIGAQRTGKTWALRSRVEVLARSEAVSSVWVLDVTGEWADYGLNGAAHVSCWPDYLKECKDDLPRVIIFDNASEWVFWKTLLEEAQGQGCVCFIMDEVYKWLPPNAHLDDAPEKALLAGRHLPALDRRLYPLHILTACQYPRSVHHLLREQAATIIVGQLRGELAESWVKGEAGSEAWDRVSNLPEFTFTTIRGERPRAPGVRWQG